MKKQMDKLAFLSIFSPEVLVDSVTVALCRLSYVCHFKNHVEFFRKADVSSPSVMWYTGCSYALHLFFYMA